MAAYVPRGIEFAEQAPVIAEASGVVDGSRADVWTTILDYEGWLEWMPSLTSCQATSTPATGVGSTREVKLAGGVRFVEEFIAWDEPEVWAFTGLDGPPVIRGLVERITLVELAPERTEVTYRMAIEPRPGFGLVVKAARPAIVRNLRRAMANLNASVAARRS